MALTFYDGLSNPNGWQAHHTADLFIAGGTYALVAVGPVGWIAIGIYTAADVATMYYKDRSITELIFD